MASAAELLQTGIENVESCFFNRFGQLIYKEPRGKLAGYKYPEVGIHRGRLHLILYRRRWRRLGAGGVVTDHECTGFEQDENGVTVHFKDAPGKTASPCALTRSSPATASIRPFASSFIRTMRWRLPASTPGAA